MFGNLAANRPYWVGLARARNMTLSEVAGLSGIEGSALLISGFGAYRTLAREEGLHVLEGVDLPETTSRMTARMLLVPVPPGEMSKARLRQFITEELSRTARATAIVRRYRRGTAPLVRTGDGSWRSGRVEDVLRGDFDIMTAR
jgi:ATP-dependent Clp protease ATP-binding subunit ClpC